MKKSRNERWPSGHVRQTSHPLRTARQLRAIERQEAHVCVETCKRFRTGKAKWPE